MNLSEWMLKAFYSVIPQDCLETFCVYVSKSCYLLPLKGPGPLIRIFKIEQYVIFFFSWNRPVCSLNSKLCPKLSSSYEVKKETVCLPLSGVTGLKVCAQGRVPFWTALVCLGPPDKMP